MLEKLVINSDGSLPTTSKELVKLTIEASLSATESRLAGKNLG